jgi:hypothetical protein
MSFLRERALAAPESQYILYFGDHEVQHRNVSTLLKLARALQSEDTGWAIFEHGVLWSSWAPGMIKQEIGEF